MTDPNLPPVTPPSGQQPPAPPAYQPPPAAPATAPAYQQEQAPYGQQPYGQPYGAPTEKYNALAIVSLVTGVLFISLVAIITGHIALSQIQKTQEKGRGLAIGGLVLGYAGIVVGILTFFFFFVPLFNYIANNPSIVNG